MEYLWFIFGLLLIIKGGDVFVDSAVNIAKILKISEIMIGATIVSVGTTLPETMVSVGAAFKGLPSVSYGNAIGTIICNTALISAITLICSSGKVDKKAISIPTYFFFGSALVYVFCAVFFKRFSRLIGFILVMIFVFYVIQNINLAKEQNKNIEHTIENVNGPKWKIMIKNILFLILSGAAIAIGANFMVDNGVIIARNLYVPETVIALTMIAFGTSLPEFVTALNAIKKGHSELSVGNIVGANFFNIVLVSGLSILVNPFDVPEGKLIFNKSSSIVVDIPIMFITMLILTLPVLKYGRTYRWQGVLMISIYICYLLFQYFY